MNKDFPSITNEMVEKTTPSMQEVILKQLASEQNSINYVVEPKLNGENVFVEIMKDETTSEPLVFVANGYKTTYCSHPFIFPGARPLPIPIKKYLNELSKRGYMRFNRAIFQGEMILGKGLLSSDTHFDLMASKADPNARIRIGIHDILEMDATNYRTYTLADRKNFLNEFLRTENLQSENPQPIRDPDRPFPTGMVSDMGTPVFKVTWWTQRLNPAFLKTHFDSLTMQGYEGIVMKSYGDPYIGAKWYKAKDYKSADTVVMAIHKTENFIKKGIPESFLVGLYEDNGSLKEFGYVSAGGLTDEEKEVIMEVLPALKTKEDSENVYLKPIIVIEVGYMMMTQNSFVQSKLMRLRPDKNPSSSRLSNIERRVLI